MNKILEVVPGSVCGCQNMAIINSHRWDDLVTSIAENGSYIPKIERVLFNIGTKNCIVRDENGKTVKDENGKVKTTSRKVLTTVIFFEDRTKCSVTNSEHDGVTFEKTESGIEVASRSSKEMGIVYCILKRCFGDIDKNDNALGNGFGRKLNDLVDNAYDTQVEEAKRKLAKSKAKAKYEASKGTAQPKQKRESLAKCVDRLTGILNTLSDKFNS